MLLIRQSLDQSERLGQLNKIVITQMQSLLNNKSSPLGTTITLLRISRKCYENPCWITISKYTSYLEPYAGWCERLTPSVKAGETVLFFFLEFYNTRPDFSIIVIFFYAIK